MAWNMSAMTTRIAGRKYQVEREGKGWSAMVWTGKAKVFVLEKELPLEEAMEACAYHAERADTERS